MAETAVLIALYVYNYSEFHFILSHFIFSSGAAEHICTIFPSIIGASMATLEGLIRYKCYQVMGKMFTSEMTIHRNHKLVISGPYVAFACIKDEFFTNDDEYCD